MSQEELSLRFYVVLGTIGILGGDLQITQSFRGREEMQTCWTTSGGNLKLMAEGEKGGGVGRI